MKVPLTAKKERIRSFLADFQLDHVDLGNADLENEYRQVPQEIRAESLWFATIDPFHQYKVSMMVIHTSAQPLAMFHFRGPKSLRDKPGKLFECPGLDDVVIARLNHLDLDPPKDQFFTLDGICYSIQVRRSGPSIDLQFSSPRKKSLKLLALALFDVAENIGRIWRRQDIVDYLQTWSRFL